MAAIPRQPDHSINFARQPVTMTQGDLINLELQLFDKIKYELNRVLPKVNKIEMTYYKGHNPEWVSTLVHDEPTNSRLAVTMVDAAIEALFRSNRVTIIENPPEEAEEASQVNEPSIVV